MTELFRSAFNYLSQTSPVNVIGKLDHHLVGTSIEVGGLRLKIRSMIAEGGYALVFSAQDTQGNWFAVKRQLAADSEAAKAILKEIRFLQELTGLQSILRFVQAAQLGPQETGHGRAEFLLLTELCPGSVSELIQKGPLSIEQVTKIFYGACNAIKQMHARNPPITHRDMKIENLLFDAHGYVKLCDFGSATTEIVTPNETWSSLQRAQVEEELARHTTPMYRAPEALDMYSNFPVGPAQDIWALGCVLYYLCYRKHPFEDSAKLRIINAKYSFPGAATEYAVLNPLIQALLRVDPRDRPNMEDLCERIEAVAAALDIDLSKPVENLELPHLSTFCSLGNLQAESSVNEHGKSLKSIVSKQSFSASRKNDYEQTVQQASAVLGAIKGQSISWFKNIKEKTAAVAQTVQSTFGNRDPDITFITSRLAIAPLTDCIPEALFAQAEEAMRAHILDQTQRQFAVYNLSNRHLRCDYGHLVETPLPSVGSGLTPTVNFLLSLCRNMVLFLKQKKTCFILVTGPEVQCLLVAASLLLYARLVLKPLAALELICSRRQPTNLPPSYHRQLDIIKTVVSVASSDLCAMVHNRRVILQSLLISPVPLFNRIRSGCRPFADVYAGGTKVWSTCKSYEELKSFDVPDSFLVDISLGDIPVGDDVQIVVYHARLTKMQNRMEQYLMFSLSFHANFINPNTSMLEFSLTDLDCQPDDSRLEGLLRVGLQLKIDDYDRGFSARDPPAILNYEPEFIPKMLLVSEPDEFDAIMLHLGLHSDKSGLQSQLKRPIPPQKHDTRQHETANDEGVELASRTTPSLAKDSFFSTLEWLNNTDNQQGVRQNVATSVQITSGCSTHSSSSLLKRAGEDADLYKDLCDMHINTAEEEIVGDHNKFDCAEQADLLGLGTDVMISTSETKTDPFSEFLACTKDNTSSLKSSSAEGTNVLSKNQQQQGYSRAHFDTFNLTGGSKLKNFENVFDDLLISQGFQTSTKTIKSLGEMKHQDNVKDLDPVEVKVREWTKGKERNIRALLGSMNNILWPAAENWIQPSIGDLLTAQQVKKYYHKACLIIHPDKQVGTENETLARAIFTELNDAWTAYESAGSPSI